MTTGFGEPCRPPRKTFDKGRYGWHRVPLADGGHVDMPRISTIAKSLDDQAPLAGWKCRQVAAGMGARPDLVALAATAAPEDRERLDEVVEAALEASQSSSAARLGTAIHAGVEAWSLGTPIDRIPPMVRAHVQAYVDLLAGAGLTVLDVEVPVVNEGLGCAGTFDVLLRLPDGRTVCGDLKSSSASAPRFSGLAWATQLSCYSTAERVDLDTGARAPIDPDLDTSLGLIVHVPRDLDAPAALYAVNLTWGLEAARLAVRARKARKTAFLGPWPPTRAADGT